MSSRLQRLPAFFALGALAISTATIADPPAQPETITSHWEDIGWSKANAGAPMSLAGLTKVWGDEFDNLDVACFDYTRKVGDHRWYTNAHDTSGIAHTHCAPGGPNPLSILNGALKITLSYTQGEWRTGAIMGNNPMGEGRAFCYPLIVGRIKLPSAVPERMDVWPSLWAETRYARPGGGFDYPEIDILETWAITLPRGTNQVTLHEWAVKNPGGQGLGASRYKNLKIPGGAPFDDQFHTYAIDTTSRRWWIYYFDGMEVARLPLLGKEMRKPLALRLDLALAAKSAPDTSASYSIYTDYVRVYQAKPTASGAEDRMVAAILRAHNGRGSSPDADVGHDPLDCGS
jgi:hypothetical protein